VNCRPYPRAWPLTGYNACLQNAGLFLQGDNRRLTCIHGNPNAITNAPNQFDKTARLIAVPRGPWEKSSATINHGMDPMQEKMEAILSHARDQWFSTYKLRICEIRTKISRQNHFWIRTLIFHSVQCLSDSVHYHQRDQFCKWNGQGHCAHLLWRNRKISSVDRCTYD
jgi:hypothetical protein